MLKTFSALRDLLEFFGWAITGGALGFIALILGTKAAEHWAKLNHDSGNEDGIKRYEGMDYDFLNVSSYNPLIPIILSSVLVASLSFGLTMGNVSDDQRALICSIVSITTCLFFTVRTWWLISNNYSSPDIINEGSESINEKTLPLIAEEKNNMAEEEKREIEPLA